MPIKKNPKLVPWESHLDKKYGKRGTPSRNKYEEGFETFKTVIIIQERVEQRYPR